MSSYSFWSLFLLCYLSPGYVLDFYAYYYLLLDGDCYMATHVDFLYSFKSVLYFSLAGSSVVHEYQQSFALCFLIVSSPGLAELQHVHAQLPMHVGAQGDIYAATWRTCWAQPPRPCTVSCKGQQPQSPQTVTSVFAAEHTYSTFSSPGGVSCLKA